jgi:hypothetical protein
VKKTRDHTIGVFLLLTVFSGVFSCGKQKPEGILSRAEMVQIMEELYIAEEKVNYLALSRDSAKRVAEVMGAKVFERAAVSDSVFRKSFDYYMERPKQMELIYTALVDTLQLREQRAPFGTEQHQ